MFIFQMFCTWVIITELVSILTFERQMQDQESVCESNLIGWCAEKAELWCCCEKLSHSLNVTMTANVSIPHWLGCWTSLRTLCTVMRWCYDSVAKKKENKRKHIKSPNSKEPSSDINIYFHIEVAAGLQRYNLADRKKNALIPKDTFKSITTKWKAWNHVAKTRYYLKSVCMRHSMPPVWRNYSTNTEA